MHMSLTLLTVLDRDTMFVVGSVIGHEDFSKGHGYSSLVQRTYVLTDFMGENAIMTPLCPEAVRERPEHCTMAHGTDPLYFADTTEGNNATHLPQLNGTFEGETIVFTDADGCLEGTLIR